jgi:hypothetical protein
MTLTGAFTRPSRDTNKREHAWIHQIRSSKLNESYLQLAATHIHTRDEHGQGSRV